MSYLKYQSISLGFLHAKLRVSRFIYVAQALQR